MKKNSKQKHMEEFTIENIQEMVFASTEQSFGKLVYFLPNIVGALLVILIGWIISYIVYYIVVKSGAKLHVGRFSKKLAFDRFLRNLGVKTPIPVIIGRFLRGYIFFMFCMGAARILKLMQIANFMDTVIKYIPNVIIALFVVLIGIQISKTVSLFVRGGLSFMDKQTASIIAGFAEFSLIFFSILTALVQLDIADELVQILFVGFVLMLAIAGGLAFGLGSKDMVAKALEDLIKHRKTRRKKSSRS